MTPPADEGHSVVSSIERYVLMGFFGLSPLFFLPFTQDFYDFHKWLLLLAVSLILLLIWAVRSMQTDTLHMTLSHKTMAFSMLSIASLISLLIASPNKVEALMSPLGLPTLLSLTLIFLVAEHSIDTQLRFTLKWLLIGSVGILSIIAVYQFVGFGKFMFPSINYLGDPLWTPVGSSIGFVAIALLVLPMLFDEAYSAIKHKHDMLLVGSIVLGITIIAGFILTLIHLVPRYTQITLSPVNGWPITLEVLKSPKQAIAGVGIENFTAAFTAGRPLSLNNSLMWNARFGTNATFLFHSTATLGLLGTIGMVFLLRCFWPFEKSRRNVGVGESITSLLAIAILLLLPPLFPLLIVVSLILLIEHNPQQKHIHIRLGKEVSWISIVLTLFIVILAIGSTYSLYRVYRGERSFFLSIKARERNDGKETYEKQVEAIRWNGNTSRYHFQLSQTSLAIANFMASNPTGTATDSGKKVLTSEERQNITNLIQQAVNEGKRAIKLSPQDVFQWENLAQIYDGIATVTPDAQKWVIATYQQAIQLDPTNPLLRITLGGKFLQQGNWDGAVQQFTIATNLKPDHANAHYNLAYAYQQRKDFLLAAREMKQTLTLVPVGSDDYNKSKKLYDELLTYLTPEEKASLISTVDPGNTIQNNVSLTPTPGF